MLYDKNILTLRKQFFSREVSFNRFKKLSVEDIEEVKRQAKAFRENLNCDRLGKLDVYNRVLLYLTSPIVYPNLKSFDEQVLFLILVCDENLSCLKKYSESQIITLKAIDEAPKEEQGKLIALRSEQMHKMIASIRETAGFYDDRVLKYETIYVKQLYQNECYESNVQKVAITPLLLSHKDVTSFIDVTDEEMANIDAIAEDYRARVSDPKSFNTLAYNIIAKRRKLVVATREERMLLLIHIIDPELMILKIYGEESTYENIKRRCIEEFGYFHRDLIRLEKAYHARFCPDKKVSEWDDEKKLLWQE